MDRNLIILCVYGHVDFKTDHKESIVFHRYFQPNRCYTEPANIYIICLRHEKEFAFELVDDEPKSCFLKYNKSSQAIEVIDLSEENHRHRPQPETWWQRVWRYLWGKWRS